MVFDVKRISGEIYMGHHKGPIVSTSSSLSPMSGLLKFGLDG